MLSPRKNKEVVGGQRGVARYMRIVEPVTYRVVGDDPRKTLLKEIVHVVELHDGKLDKALKGNSSAVWFQQCYVAKDLSKCLHGTVTEVECEQLVKEIQHKKTFGRRCRRYRFSESHLKKGRESDYELPLLGEVVDRLTKVDEPFLKVINQGTKEFIDLGLDAEFLEMDMNALGMHVLENKKHADPSRTNLQLNYGFSCGQNVQRKDKEVESDYGSSMNHLNTGTQDFAGLMVQQSRLLGKLGVWWAGNDVDGGDGLKHRLSLFANTLSNENVIEGLTIALLQLHPEPAVVSDHVDGSNDPYYTETLVCNAVTNLQGAVYRVSVICYMRKACGDSTRRRMACEETANETMKFVKGVCKGRRAFDKPCQAEPYYENAGQMGLAVSVTLPSMASSGLMKVHSAALLSLPHLDKPFSFLSPVSCLLRRIYKKHKNLCVGDLVNLALPVGHLNTFFPYCVVLESILNQEKVHPVGQLGCFGLVVKKLTNLSGSYSSGGLRRAQVWWKDKHIDTERTLRDLAFIRDECEKSVEHPKDGKSYQEHCRDEFHRITDRFCKGIYSVGMFSAHHVIGVLVQTGLLRPIGMLHEARFAVGTSTMTKNKRGNGDAVVKNPKMVEYLFMGHSTNKIRDERGRKVMEGVVEHIRKKRGIPGFTSSQLEQASCERLRKQLAVDFVFPRSSQFHLSPLRQVQDGIREVSGEYVGGKFSARSCESLSLPARSEREVSWQHQANSPLGPCIATSGTVGAAVTVRLPLESILSFDGLLEKTRTMFFPHCNEMDTGCSVQSWIENSSVMKGLVLLFAARSQPLQCDLDWLNGKVNLHQLKRERLLAKISSELYLPVDRRLKHSNTFSSSASITDKHGQCKNDECNICAGGCSSCVAKAIVSSECEVASDVEQSHRTSPNHSSAVAEPVMSCETSWDGVIAVPSGVEVSTNIEQPIPRSRSTSNSFYFHHIPNRTHWPRLINWPPSLWTTKSKILASSRGNGSVVFGTIHNEARNAMFFGVSSEQFPLQVKGSQIEFFEHIPHEVDILDGSQLSQTLYSASLYGERRLPFFRANTCMLVDRIAKVLGGAMCRSRKSTGMVMWLFKNPAIAERHLLLCILFLAGKSGYFLNLVRRAAKVRTGVSDCAAIAVRADRVLPSGINGNVVFYVLLPPKTTNRTQHWIHVPSESGSEREHLVFDPCTWKDTIGNLHMDVLLQVPQSVSGCAMKALKPRGSGTRRKRKRMRKSPKKDVADGTEVIDLS